MADFTLSVAIDPEDLKTIRNMGDPANTLFPYYREAMSESLDELEFQAQDWMWAHFTNPTGKLENAFEKIVGTFESELWNDLPYSQRRNYGFSGMTDALGRYYPYDPGIAWAENAIANSYPYVELIWQIAIDKALGRI